jgi:integrase
MRGKFTQRFVNSAKDGTYTDGSGLYLIVRKSGRARSWSFRHRGKRISPPGGSAHNISVEQAQAFVRQCRDQLANGNDPFSRQANQASVRKLTFKECFTEFCAHKGKRDWGRQAKQLGRTIANNYVNASAHADLPVQDITDIPHMLSILEPTWNTKPVIAKRAGFTICAMFRWAKSTRRFLGENPAVITKDSALGLALGRQQRPGHRVPLNVDDVPKLIAFLRSPRYSRFLRHSSDVCTVSEAMEAIGTGREPILRAIRQGKIRGAYKPLWKEKEWLQSPYLIPVKELKKLFPTLRYPIPELAHIPVHAWVLQFLVFTLVRSDMGCSLHWDQINRKRGLIEYGHEHKTGRHSDQEYNIVITDGVTEILNAMEAHQRREKLDSEYVFVHGATRFGISTRFGERANPNTVNTYLKRALQWIPDITDRDATVHGFRTTFPEWACELNEYEYELVKAQLGHIIGQQTVDPIYFRKVSFLDRRKKMMTQWEKYCLSLSDKSQQTNVIPLITAN